MEVEQSERKIEERKRDAFVAAVVSLKVYLASFYVFAAEISKIVFHPFRAIVLRCLSKYVIDSAQANSA